MQKLSLIYLLIRNTHGSDIHFCSGTNGDIGFWRSKNFPRPLPALFVTALPHPVDHPQHINLPSALSFSAGLDVDVGVGVQEPPEHGGVVGHDAGDAAAEGPPVGGLRVEHPHVHPDAPGAQVLEQPRGKPTYIGWLCSFSLHNAIAVVFLF